MFENTQEAIVDSETWHLAQKLIGTPRRSDTIGEANPLTGLVFCADCGAKMYNHRSRPYTNQDGRKIPGFDGYDCSTHKLSTRRVEGSCCSHHISTKALREYPISTAIAKIISSAQAKMKLPSGLESSLRSKKPLCRSRVGRKVEATRRKMIATNDNGEGGKSGDFPPCFVAIKSIIIEYFGGRRMLKDSISKFYQKHHSKIARQY